MPKILTFTVEVSDAEHATFMERIATRGTIVTSDDDDTGPADPNAPQVDKNGVPWIEAVHATTKKLNADGSWRRRKGVTAEAATQAEQAHKAQAPATVSPTFTPSVPFGGNPTPVEAAQPAAAPTGFPGFPQPSAPVAPAPVSFEDISNYFQTLSAAGRLDPNKLGPMYAEAGSQDMNQYAADESLRARLMGILKRDYPV